MKHGALTGTGRSSLSVALLEAPEEVLPENENENKTGQALSCIEVSLESRVDWRCIDSKRRIEPQVHIKGTINSTVSCFTPLFHRIPHNLYLLS